VTFIETVPEDDATAAVEEMYEAVRGSYGHYLHPGALAEA
jgi:hypothetical protein